MRGVFLLGVCENSFSLTMTGDKMWRAVGVLCLLVLGSAWTLPLEPLTTVSAQENFDLSRFMGKWYKVALVSTCPHLMRRYSANPIIATVELEKADDATNVTKTIGFPRDGACQQMTSYYGLTDRPGVFSYYSSRMNADVESYVVETDYNDYAILVSLSMCRLTGKMTKILNLYGRSVEVTEEVLNNFKAHVIQQGLEPDSIIMGRDQGQCVLDGPPLRLELQNQA